jgi:hypothetical protein
MTQFSEADCSESPEADTVGCDAMRNVRGQAATSVADPSAPKADRGLRRHMSPARTMPALPDGATMAIWALAAIGGVRPAEPIHQSAGKWLHPLFDLLELQHGGALAAAGELFLRDRVIGRGAAFLILRAGIRDAWADVVSDGALSLFAAHGATLDGVERVPAISCVTEELLRGVDDPETAWRLLLTRRRAAR